MRATNLMLRSLKTISALLILTLPLSGCGLGDVLKLLFPRETVTIVVAKCPEGIGLDAPPEPVLDALATVVDDPQGGPWIDQLEKHYEDLDACRRAR